MADNEPSDASSKTFKVPTFLTGIVSRAEGVDFCMDGAEFRLQSMGGVARLKPSSDEVKARLQRYAGSRLRVTVAGYPTWGPECGYLSVYFAAPAQEFHDSVKNLLV